MYIVTLFAYSLTILTFLLEFIRSMSNNNFNAFDNKLHRRIILKTYKIIVNSPYRHESPHNIIYQQDARIILALL